jgi:hypothetical protein
LAIIPLKQGRRDAIAKDAPDTLVALASAQNDTILVSFDRDRKAIASRFHISHGRPRKLSRIDFVRSEPKAAARIQLGLALIEAEWAAAQQTNDHRMFIVIQDNAFKTIR